MDVSEKVAESYIKRVFGAKVLMMKDCKILFFPENILAEKGWTKHMFKNLCDGVVSVKSSLRIYRADVTVKRNNEKK